MRLFQAQTFYGDATAPPPPPHFSIEREATRVMPVYLNQYRDGRRLPTPEKVAVMELSSSFERRRLGKHQQILNDISQRCREQEVTDLSGSISVKVNLKKFDKQNREMTFYSTSFLDSKKKKRQSSFPETSLQHNNGSQQIDLCDAPSPRTTFEKAYKHFPARRIMRQNSKFDFLKPTSPLPKIPMNFPKTSFSDSPRPGKGRHINGTIQMEHILSSRSDLAPLVLPGSEESAFHGVQSERLERSGTYFSTRGVVLGQRSKTQLTFGNSKTEDGSITIPPLNVRQTAGYGQEISAMQMSTGNSPPPNSVQELEGVTA